MDGLVQTKLNPYRLHRVQSSLLSRHQAGRIPRNQPHKKEYKGYYYNQSGKHPDDSF